VSTDHALIEAERGAYASENDLNPRYRAYARGDQPSTLTPEQAELLANLTGNARADNICHQVCAEAADRVQMEGWQIETNAAVQAFADELYIKSAVADIQGEAHYNANRDGNTALLVSPTADGTRIRLTLEEWWDGRQGVFISPGGEGREPYAVKDRLVWGEGARAGLPVWVSADTGAAAVASGVDTLRVRRFVYYADRIEKWQRADLTVAGAEWEPFEDPADAPGTRYVGGERHIVAWEEADGSPLHIPYVHFANAGRMHGIQGLSELAGGVLSFQDDLNENDADLAAATRLTAFQILWIKGYTAEIDEITNKAIAPDLKLAPGVFLRDTSADFAAGAIPAGDITQIIAAKNEKLASVARSTRTPRHTISGGDWPSGDALERAERPAVDKARRQAAKFGPAWATVLHRAVEQANTFGKAGMDENALIVTRFGEFERRDPLYTLSVERAKLALAVETETRAPFSDRASDAANASI